MDTSMDSRRRKRKADDIGDESLDAPALDTKSKMVAESRRTRVASNSLLKRSNSLSATDTEDRLLAQLPLQRGRKVAFCQPQRGEVLAGDDGEVWIMATVIGSINNDPHRYIVQDAEDEGTAGPYVRALTQDLQYHDQVHCTTSQQRRFTAARRLPRWDARPGTLSGYQLLLQCYDPGRGAGDLEIYTTHQGMFLCSFRSKSARQNSCIRRTSSCLTTTARTSSTSLPTWSWSIHR